jgi:F-type H+-transporting ATPase subunit alpha
VEVLKQGQYQPLPVEHQIMIIYAVTNGFLDDVDAGKIHAWETAFLEFVSASRPGLGRAIRTKKALDDDLTAQVRKAIEDFKAIR